MILCQKNVTYFLRLSCSYDYPYGQILSTRVLLMGLKNAFQRDFTQQTYFYLHICPSHFTFHLPPNMHSDTIKSLNEVLSYDHEAESQALRMVGRAEGWKKLSPFWEYNRNPAPALTLRLVT